MLFFLLTVWLLTLLNLNNGVFPFTVQRSYVQLRIIQLFQFNVAHISKSGQVDWSEPLFFLYSLVICMGQREAHLYWWIWLHVIYL